MKEISIVIAVHNEEENIKPLIDNIEQALRNKLTYEVIFVDDGSTDNTANTVKKFIDSNIVLIELKRNVGQSGALQAGIDHATGKYIATMDGDLQNDAEDLPVMLDILKKNDCDFVTGIRENRSDKILTRKIPSYIANYIVRKITHTNIKDNGCGIKVFRSEILKEMYLYGEKHRFMASFAAMEGATYQQIPVKHHPRVHGKSKYGLNRTMKVVADLLLINFSRKFGQKPMYLFGTTGLLILLSGASILIFLLFQKIFGGNIWGRPIMILGILFVFVGFQTISTGLILDMLIRNIYEKNSTKPYKVKRISRAA